jgi:hypothetical protein
MSPGARTRRGPVYTEERCTFEPIQSKYYTRPTLTDAMRRTLGEKLRGAPADALAHRQSLRLAARVPAERDPRLEIMYFAPGFD